MRSIEVEVRDESGLHARPAAAFVRLASGFASAIRLENLSAGGSAVDARSVIGVLSAGVEKGHLVRITAEGPDETAAASALGASLAGTMRPEVLASGEPEA